MSSDRPTEHSYCVKTGEGKGDWVTPSLLKRRWINKKNNLIRKLYSAKVHLKVKQPIYQSVIIFIFICIFNYVAFKHIKPSFPYIDYIASLLTSISASIIIHLTIFIYPKKLKIQKYSHKIALIIKDISDIKYLQYVNLGYIKHWTDEDYFTQKNTRDTSINNKKLNKLFILMNETFLSNHPTHPDHSISSYYNKQPFTNNKEYFENCHEIFIVKLQELKNNINEEHFPNFYFSITTMIANLKRPTILNYLKINLNHEVALKEYINRHFEHIEMVECLYELECKPFTNYTYGNPNYFMEFSNDFKKQSYHPRLHTMD